MNYIFHFSGIPRLGKVNTNYNCFYIRKNKSNTTNSNRTNKYNTNQKTKKKQYTKPLTPINCKTVVKYNICNKQNTLKHCNSHLNVDFVLLKGKKIANTLNNM